MFKMMQLRPHIRSFQTAFFAITCLAQITAGQQSCGLCTNGSIPPDHLDETATLDGRTCRELEIEALGFDQSDPICGSLYNVIGFSNCGCAQTETLDPQNCSLCPDGSDLFQKDSLYSSIVTLASCDQVRDYLLYTPQSSESCDAIQYQGVVNCGCPSVEVIEPKCNLCENDGDRVSNPDAFAAETTTLPIKNITCGVLEYILAKDLNDEFDVGTCNSVQYQMTTKCTCSEILVDPTMSPTEERQTNNPSNYVSVPSSHPSISSSSKPSLRPTNKPTEIHDGIPSNLPSSILSSSPSIDHSNNPSADNATISPTRAPSSLSIRVPSSSPTEENIRPSISPSITATSNPTFFPSITSSHLPSLIGSTSRPSAETTPVPSVTRSEYPSYVPSIAPTSSPSVSPSVTPSASPSMHPSSSPISIIDMSPNCTALANGIFPDVMDIANITVFNLYFDLFAGKEIMTNLTRLQEEVKGTFDRKISTLTAECPDGRRRLDEIAQNIYFVQMRFLKQILDVECTSPFPQGIQDDKESGIACFPMGIGVVVYFSTSSLSQNLRNLVASADGVETYVSDIIEVELPSILAEIPGVHSANLVDSFADVGGASSNQVAIGVGIGCSAIFVVLVGILFMGKRKRTSQDDHSIIPGRHVRSDGSISDNPSASSDKRRMPGWEGSIQSVESDGCSDYSHRIANIKGDEDNVGIRRPYSYDDASYLPVNVLKDLLGHDGDLSLGDETIDL